eukprot:gnl/MRDRNA2_/MRDRNA2_83530_c0_seq10.p1 gnl/MRDRNA2_/MRDRNA2_83530_c0~~gnl/MRDRNA2_/MRDRNA2_83530_c0_seq10.p1  ORF type:complete len:136 (-),score=21.98 gnl/MRDRNA2_/MRDRNA2_83530_c0_seq10:40-447(-)
MPDIPQFARKTVDVWSMAHKDEDMIGVIRRNWELLGLKSSNSIVVSQPSSKCTAPNWWCDGRSNHRSTVLDDWTPTEGTDGTPVYEDEWELLLSAPGSTAADQQTMKVNLSCMAKCHVFIFSFVIGTLIMNLINV